MDIKDLVEKRFYCEVKYGPVGNQESIQIAFAPHRYTKEMHARTLEIAQDPHLPTEESLLDLLTDWDITEEREIDGKTVAVKLSIDEASLDRLPVMLKVNMLNAIMIEVMNSGKATSYTSKPTLSLVGSSDGARSTSVSSGMRNGSAASRRGNS